MLSDKESEYQKVAVFDCQTAGVAGDMLLGALIDAGADINKISSAIKTIESATSNYTDIKVAINQVARGGFKATQINVTAQTVGKIKGQQLVEIVENSSERLNFSERAKQFASNSIRTLVNAEAELHADNLKNAHLHEVGLVDTPAEIIGTAVAMEDLRIFKGKVYVTPVAVGGGILKSSHGIIASPAPATLEIFRSKNFPILGGPIEAELATPTGAAMIVNVADEVTRFYPAMKPLRVGYGAGTKEFKEIPNCLRLTVGESAGKELLKDEIAILETNIDDVTGEVIGYTFDRLLLEGAKDVSIIPIFAKKNRPGQILRVIVNPKDIERISWLIMEETGTLGVRINTCERYILNREVHQLEILIDDRRERVAVKVVKDNHGKNIQTKPEFEDVKRIAEKHHIPFREVLEITAARARETFLEK